MSEDICQTVIVDGEPVLVRVSSLLTPEEVEAFAWVVRAAKRKHATEHPRFDPGDGRQECEVCGRFVWPVTHSCKGIRS